MSRVFNLSKYDSNRFAIETIKPEPLPAANLHQLVREKLQYENPQLTQLVLNQLADQFVKMFEGRSQQEILQALSGRLLSRETQPQTYLEVARLRDAVAEAIKMYSKGNPNLAEAIKMELGEKLEVLNQRVFKEILDVEFDPFMLDVMRDGRGKGVPEKIENSIKFMALNASDPRVRMVAESIKEFYFHAAKNKILDFINNSLNPTISVLKDETKEANLRQWILFSFKTSNIANYDLFDSDLSSLPSNVISNFQKLIDEYDKVTISISSQLKTETPSVLYTMSSLKEGSKAYQNFLEKFTGSPEKPTDEEKTQLLQGLMEISDSLQTFDREEILLSLGYSKARPNVTPSNLFDTADGQIKPIDRISNRRMLMELLKAGGYLDSFESGSIKALPLEKRASDIKLTREQQEQIKNLFPEGIVPDNYVDVLTQLPSTFIDSAIIWLFQNKDFGNSSKANIVAMMSKPGTIPLDLERDIESDTDEEVTGEEQIDDLGIPYPLAKKLVNTKNLEDDLYTEDYGITLRSQKEKECIDLLRTQYGLTVVPSSLGIPTVDGCYNNKFGFQIDFLIRCPSLNGWELLDERHHPQVESQTTFVGEYFGFARPWGTNSSIYKENGDYNVETIPPTEAEAFLNPDGTIATFEMPSHAIDKLTPNDRQKLPLSEQLSTNPKFQYVQAKSGIPIPPDQKYKLATKWKKMTETFAANMLGASAIHIENLESDKIQSELNRCGIIYKFRNRVVENTPLFFLEQHNQTCEDCATKLAQFSNKTYNKKEAYIHAKITELQMSHIFEPVMSQEKQKRIAAVTAFHANRNTPYVESLQEFHSSIDDRRATGEDIGFGRYEIYQYYQEKVNIESQLLALRSAPPGSYDINQEIQLRNRLVEIKRGLDTFKQKINNAMQDPKYLEILQNMQELLARAESDDPSLTDIEVKTKIDSLFKAYIPYAQGKTTSKIANIGTKTSNIESLLYRLAISS